VTTSLAGAPGYALDHCALGVRRVEDALPLLVDVLGGEEHEGGPGIGFQGGQWRFAGGGVIEVIEPTGPPGGFLHRFLERRGPGVHHVTFKVPRLREAADRARAFGYEIVGYHDAFPGWQECFLHPREAQGIVVQLAASDPAAAGDWGAGWRFPARAPGAPPPPAPARVLGPRLVARDEKAAARQWGELLGGAQTRSGDTLVFRWPGCGLRIAVDLDPGAREEGPVAVEVAARPGLVLPDGVVPVLGTRFVAVSEEDVDAA